LAVGNPAESVKRHDPLDQSTSDQGAVYVIYGSASGLSAKGSQVWHQNSRGIKGVAEDFDNFGRVLAAGQFAGRKYDDLAIGVPGEGVGPKTWTGGVNVIYGSARGLTAVGNQFWNQATAGIAGQPEEDDEFGWSLAAANFGRDTDGHAYCDLAIGVPGESLGAKTAGMVALIYGAAGGLSARHSRTLSQDSRNIAGVAKSHEAFGLTLAAANFGQDRGGAAYADLAVGDHFEDIDSDVDAGTVNIVYGSANGLTSRGNALLTARSLGRPIEAKPYLGYFGYTLSAGADSQAFP
jgi:hypothetical protein